MYISNYHYITICSHSHKSSAFCILKFIIIDMKNIDKIKIKDLIYNTNRSFRKTFSEKFYLLDKAPGQFKSKNNIKRITKTKTKKENKKISEKIKDVFINILMFLCGVLILLLIAAAIDGSIIAVIFAIIYICKIYIGEIKVFTILLYIFPWFLFFSLFVLSLFRLYYVGINNKRLIIWLIKIFLYLVNIIALVIQILGLIKITKYEFMLNFIIWFIVFQTFSTIMDSICLNKQKKLDICLYEILFLEFFYNKKLFDFDNYLWRRKRLLRKIKVIFRYHFCNNKRMTKITDKIINNLKISENKLLFYNLNNELDFLSNLPIRRKNLSH